MSLSTPQETDTVRTTQAAPEPIAADAARQRIQQAIVTQLGPDWDDEDTGWMVIHDADYLVRLTDGKRNLDFQCDLLGEVIVEERELNPLQGSGRLIAWMLLGASLLIAFVLARIAGVL